MFYSTFAKWLLLPHSYIKIFAQMQCSSNS